MVFSSDGGGEGSQNGKELYYTVGGVMGET